MESKPLKLSSKDLTASELIHLLPAKLSNNQKGSLFAALKSLKTIDLNLLIMQLELEE